MLTAILTAATAILAMIPGEDEAGEVDTAGEEEEEDTVVLEGTSGATGMTTRVGEAVEGGRIMRTTGGTQREDATK